MIWFVKKIKLAPSYIRMVGTITLERFDGENCVGTLSENGIWEQMYFGLDEDVGSQLTGTALARILDNGVETSLHNHLEMADTICEMGCKLCLNMKSNCSIR